MVTASAAALLACTRGLLGLSRERRGQWGELRREDLYNTLQSEKIPSVFPVQGTVKTEGIFCGCGEPGKCLVFIFFYLISFIRSLLVSQKRRGQSPRHR